MLYAWKYITLIYLYQYDNLLYIYVNYVKNFILQLFLTELKILIFFPNRL